MNKLNRLDYLRFEHATFCNKIAHDRYLLASQDFNEDEKEAIKKRIQHMEWVAGDYLTQIEAVSTVIHDATERYKYYV